MTILPYKLDTTNDLLTSRAGLLSIAHLMDSLSLAERIDELLSKVVFQHLNQAATWSTFFTSIPSLNLTPVITFAR